MPYKCLIIAAGIGRRMQKKGPIKPLVPMLGRPLIEWVVCSAVKAGLNELYIVIGYRGHLVRKFINLLSDKYCIQITPIINEQWNKDNGLSVLKAVSILKDDFILLMADHVVDFNVLQEIKTRSLTKNEDIILVVDHRMNNPLVDVNDATKVYADNQRVLSIGKNLKQFNAFDTGVFLCSTKLFDALEYKSRYGDNTSLSGGIRYLAGKKRVATMDIGQRFWIDIDDTKMLDKAERFISSTFNSYWK